MDKRQFLKASGVVLADSLITRVANSAGAMNTDTRTNWAGNLTYSAKQLDELASGDQIVQLVKSRSPLKHLARDTPSTTLPTRPAIRYRSSRTLIR